MRPPGAAQCSRSAVTISSELGLIMMGMVTESATTMMMSTKEVTIFAT